MSPTMTPSMRPVSKAVNDVIGEIPTGGFNFGLYFNKWFYVVDGSSNHGFSKKICAWACSVPTEGKSSIAPANPDPIQNFHSSICLFNDKKIGNSKWIRQTSEALLTGRLQAQEQLVKAFKKLGYESIPIKAKLRASLVIGLGNEHPMEKSFRFDWTLGIPIIPSSSIKGVVRLAYLVRELEKYDGPDIENILQRLSKGELPSDAQQVFGAANATLSKSEAAAKNNESARGTERSLRGKVIFLDAFPTQLPLLKAEIMNCHFREYLDGKRGPTEDQQPNPQKFWAVDRLLKDGKTPLTFIFRILIGPEIVENAKQKEKLLEAIKAALEEHGLGAKTAIGHGHFKATTASSSEAVSEEASTLSSPQKAEPVRHIWEKASLSWKPNETTIYASSGTLKAFVKGKSTIEMKEMVPEALRKNLFERRKPVTATVEVEQVGNAFKIIRIK
ncbi:MAG: type III-B CRISPR module RAMP protein Cmr6 [Deltaproteobacteria bacterium]|jgi:CRISPR-associated protein Cmr6|nr:type III-B CRISPR module RAMP protein Cmr6 [Deltaproteobacteria bacterium]